jgi:hypothetical protein
MELYIRSLTRMKRILLDAHVCHDLLGREYLSMRN